MDSNGPSRENMDVGANLDHKNYIKKPIPRTIQTFNIWNVNAYFRDHHNQNQMSILRNILSQRLNPLSLKWLPSVKYLQSLQIGNKLNMEQAWNSECEDKSENKPILHQKSECKIRPTKIYDKFSIDDIDQIELSDEDMESEDQDEDDALKNDEIWEKSDQLEVSDIPKNSTAFKSPEMEECEIKHNKNKIKINLPLTNNSIASATILNMNKFADSISEENMVGLLTKEQRDEKVRRYLEKKRKRKEKQINSFVRYECRKDLADHRFRLQGRFIKLDDIQKLQKEYIFDTKTRKLIKPIFKTQKIRGKQNLFLERNKASSDEDATMDIIDN